MPKKRYDHRFFACVQRGKCVEGVDLPVINPAKNVKEGRINACRKQRKKNRKSAKKIDDWEHERISDEQLVELYLQQRKSQKEKSSGNEVIRFSGKEENSIEAALTMLHNKARLREVNKLGAELEDIKDRMVNVLDEYDDLLSVSPYTGPMDMEISRILEIDGLDNWRNSVKNLIHGYATKCHQREEVLEDVFQNLVSDDEEEKAPSIAPDDIEVVERAGDEIRENLANVQVKARKLNFLHYTMLKSSSGENAKNLSFQAHREMDIQRTVVDRFKNFVKASQERKTRVNAWKYAADEIVGLLKSVRDEGTLNVIEMEKNFSKLMSALNVQTEQLEQANMETRKQRQIATSARQEKEQLKSDNILLEGQLESTRKQSRAAEQASKMLQAKLNAHLDEIDDTELYKPVSADDEERKEIIYIQRMRKIKARIGELQKENTILQSENKSLQENFEEVNKKHEQNAESESKDNCPNCPILQENFRNVAEELSLEKDKVILLENDVKERQAQIEKVQQELLQLKQQNAKLLQMSQKVDSADNSTMSLQSSQSMLSAQQSFCPPEISNDQLSSADESGYTSHEISSLELKNFKTRLSRVEERQISLTDSGTQTTEQSQSSAFDKAVQTPTGWHPSDGTRQNHIKETSSIETEQEQRMTELSRMVNYNEFDENFTEALDKQVDIICQNIVCLTGLACAMKSRPDLGTSAGLVKITSSLEKTDLDSAHFDEQNLAIKNLEYRDIGEQELESRDVKKTNLEEEHLNKKNLQKINLEKTNLKKTDSEKTDMDMNNSNEIYLNQTNVERTDFDKTNLEEKDMDKTNLDETAVFENTKLNKANVDKKDLEKSNVKMNNFQETYSEETNFDSNSDKASLGKTDLEKASMTRTNLDTTNLDDKDLKKTSWNNMKNKLLKDKDRKPETEQTKSEGASLDIQQWENKAKLSIVNLSLKSDDKNEQSRAQAASKNQTADSGISHADKDVCFVKTDPKAPNSKASLAALREELKKLHKNCDINMEHFETVNDETEESTFERQIPSWKIDKASEAATVVLTLKNFAERSWKKFDAGITKMLEKEGLSDQHKVQEHVKLMAGHAFKILQVIGVSISEIPQFYNARNVRTTEGVPEIKVNSERKNSDAVLTTEKSALWLPTIAVIQSDDTAVDYSSGDHEEMSTGEIAKVPEIKQHGQRSKQPYLPQIEDRKTYTGKKQKKDFLEIGSAQLMASKSHSESIHEKALADIQQRHHKTTQGRRQSNVPAKKENFRTTRILGKNRKLVALLAKSGKSMQEINAILGLNHEGFEQQPVSDMNRLQSTQIGLSSKPIALPKLADTEREKQEQPKNEERLGDLKAVLSASTIMPSVLPTQQSGIFTLGNSFIQQAPSISPAFALSVGNAPNADLEPTATRTIRTTSSKKNSENAADKRRLSHRFHAGMPFKKTEYSMQMKARALMQQPFKITGKNNKTDKGNKTVEFPGVKRKSVAGNFHVNNIKGSLFEQRKQRRVSYAVHHQQQTKLQLPQLAIKKGF